MARVLSSGLSLISVRKLLLVGSMKIFPLSSYSRVANEWQVNSLFLLGNSLTSAEYTTATKCTGRNYWTLCCLVRARRLAAVVTR